MKYLLIVVLFCVGAYGRDLSDVAHDITLEKAPKEYAEFKKKTTSSFDTWLNDNQSGSMKIFLDNNLIKVITSATAADTDDNKTIKNIKIVMFWLSMYKDNKEPIPSFISDAPTEIIHKFDNIRSDFSWKRLALFTKQVAADSGVQSDVPK